MRSRLPPALVLAVAVAAVSWAGPLIRFSHAPALAIATWRLVFSVACIGLVVAVSGGPVEWRDLSRREIGLAVAAGLMLAGHFWSWIASLEYTSIASSVVLVSTQPIFVGLLSLVFLGEQPTPIQWTGIGVAVVGAAVIGWGDFSRGPSPFFGDVLAVVGAIFVSGYYVVGRSLRRRLGLWTYTGVVYGIAALALLGASASTGVRLGPYPAREWLIFALLALGPMMLGHTGVNYALRYIRAYVANLALLGEPVGATLLAWVLPSIHEVPPPQTIAGGTLILAGIALGVRRGLRPVEPGPDDVAIER